MATEAQINANRENAKKSTGPRTPEGKAASSRNHLKHGLCADRYLLIDEHTTEFLDLLNDFIDRYRPVGDVEEKLVQRIACNQWRLHRAGPIETQIYREQFAGIANNRDLTPEERAGQTELLGRGLMRDGICGKNLDRLSRYETALERSIERCKRQLTDFRKERLAEAAVPADPEPEIEIPADPPPPPKTEITVGTQSNAGIALPANGGDGAVLQPQQVIRKTLPAYAQDPAETLHIAIAGPQEPQHSQLAVSRTAHLDGALNINLLNGYLPEVGQTFTILSAAQVTGAFQTINGLTITTDRRFRLIQTKTTLLLTVQQT